MESNDEQVDKFVDWGSVEFRGIERQVENRPLLLCRKTPRKVGLELLDQHRNAFLAATTVPDGIFDDHFLELSAVDELDGNRVGDRALVRIQVVLREFLVLDTDHLRTQAVDAGILR